MKNLSFVGMLWRIDNPKTTPLDKALEYAVKHYKKKYGSANICTMKKEMKFHLPDSINIMGDEIFIYEDDMVQNNHFVIGFDDGSND